MIKEIDGVLYYGFFDETGKFQILDLVPDDEFLEEWEEDEDYEEWIPELLFEIR